MNAPSSAPAQYLLIPGLKEAVLTVTIVICTRNRPGLLRQCLQAVARLNPKPDEVLIVDNTQGNKETEEAAGELGARYTIEPVPGLSRARNRGMAECNTDIVAYLDDDAIPEPDWLGLILEPFVDERVGSVTGETVESLAVSEELRGKTNRTHSKQDSHWFEMATFGGLGIGANMALRRSIAGSSLFDTRLGRGTPIRIGEESRAFASLLERGYVAVHVPSALVLHTSLPLDVELEASSSAAYWLLLFFESPHHRLRLISFLWRRIRRVPLSWERNPQVPGEIITSGWRKLCKAGVKGLWLFLRTPRPKSN